MIRLISKHSQLLTPCNLVTSRHFSTSLSHLLFKPVHISNKTSPDLILKYSQSTPNLSALNNQDLAAISNEFSLKPRHLKTEKELCISLLKEISSRFENNKLTLDQFISSSKALNAYPETTSILESVLNNKIQPTSPYLTMHELAQLIDLVFLTYKSGNFELCSRAVTVFNSRCSHLYKAIHLMEVFEISLRLQVVFEPTIKVINKLNYFIQSKIELDDFDDNIKLIEKLKDCDESNHRLITNFPVRQYFYMTAKDKTSISARSQMIYAYEIVQLIKMKFVHITLGLKNSIINDLVSKVKPHNLYSMNYGLLLDAIVYLSANIPKEFLKFFEELLRKHKRIDFSYALCYANLTTVMDVGVPEMTEQQEQDFEMLPISEVLKIHNLTHSVKGVKDPFFKKLNYVTLRILTKASSSGDYEKITEILEYVDNNFMSKKALVALAKVIENCLVNIHKDRELLSTDRYYKILFRFYRHANRLVHQYIEDLYKETEKSEMISLLRQKFNLNLQSLSDFYESFPEFTDNDKLYSVLININSNSTINEFIESRKLMNKLSGSVYSMDNFEILINKWYKFVYSKGINNYFIGFLKNLNNYMKTLPESEFSTNKALIITKMLRDLRCLDNSIAEKVALAHFEDFSNDQVLYLSIAYTSKSPQIQEIITSIILPELQYTWQSFDVKTTINRLKVVNQVMKSYPELEPKFLSLIEQKITKWFHLYTEIYIEILESINDEEFCDNPDISRVVIETISERVLKEDMSTKVKLLTVYFDLFCRLAVKSSKHLKQVFIEIGKNYFKFTIELKISILKSLGTSGLANKELFKIVFMDLQKQTDLPALHATDALSALCDCNLEGSDYAGPIYRQLIGKLYTEHKFQNIFNAKIFFCLAKPRLFDTEILDLLSRVEVSPFFYHEQPQKFLISYYLMASRNVKIMNDEDLQEWNEIITDFCLWKINPLEIEKAYNVLKGLGIEAEVSAVKDNIRVPLFVRDSGTVIVPKTPYNTILNSESLKGEQASIVEALQNFGYTVKVHDFSTPFSLST